MMAYMANPEIVAVGSCYLDINSVIGEPWVTDGEQVGGTYETVAGGSAVNFCRFSRELGMSPTFIGVAGDDPMAELVRLQLCRNNIACHIKELAGRQTNIGWNVTNTATNEHRMEVRGNANQAMDAEDVLPNFKMAAESADWAYLGGLFKLKGLWNDLEEFRDITTHNRVPLVVDHGRIPKDAGNAVLRAMRVFVWACDYYLPSREEFLQLWDVPSIEAGLCRLHEQAPELTVIVKDGTDGAVYWQEEEAVRVRPPEVVQGEVTGAGDSFNAGVIAAISHQRSTADSVAFGCAVAVAKIAGRPLPPLETD